MAIPITKPVRYLFAATAIALVSIGAGANEPLYPTFERQKWEFRVGAFGLTTQALVGSTRNGRPDFIIDLGKLGITESTSEPWVSLIAPLGSNWNVRLEYFTYSESGKVVATEDFEYDDLMVTTGAVGYPLGDDPSGLRIIKVYQDRIEHEYYGLDNIPVSVE